MHSSTVFGVFLAIWFVSPSSLVGQTTHRIGGPRDLEVVFERSSQEFVLTVQMNPVTAFDRMTNLELTVLKSKAYALSFLQKELSKSGDPSLRKGKVLNVSQVEVKNLTRETSKCRVLVRVPRIGISWVKASPVIGRPNPESLGIDIANSSLLSRKSDIRQTIETVHYNYFVIHQNDGTLSDKRFEAFDNYERSMERMKSIIQKDRLLLGDERKELDAVINSRLREYSLYHENLGCSIGK